MTDDLGSPFRSTDLYSTISSSSSSSSMDPYSSSSSESHDSLPPLIDPKPLPAPPLPTSKPSVPCVVRESPKKILSEKIYIFLACVLGVISIGVLFSIQYGTFECTFHPARQGEILPYPKENFMPLPMINYYPTTKCVQVDKNDIVNKTLYQHVLYSLHYYMYHENYEAITAFHVGSPICLVLLRDEPDKVVELYNPEFRAFSTEKVSLRKESSAACPQITRFVSRVDYIQALYRDGECGELHKEMFKHQQAWALQSAVLYLQSRSICSPSNENSAYDATALPSLIEQSVKMRGCQIPY